MEKYVKVYPWEVLDLVKGNECVYMLDRKRGDVFYVNEMRVCDLLKVLKTEDHSNRYDFWRFEVVTDGEL